MKTEKRPENVIILYHYNYRTDMSVKLASTSKLQSSQCIFRNLFDNVCQNMYIKYNIVKVIVTDKYRILSFDYAVTNLILFKHLHDNQ